MFIEVKEGKNPKDNTEELNRALKVFNSMVKKSELIQELRRREHFVKPSKKKILKMQEARRKRKREERKQARQKKY
jgi:ribosomal protein S21